MYIAIAVALILLYCIYKSIDSKKTNQRNIDVGKELFEKTVLKKIIEKKPKKELIEEQLDKHIFYLQQSVSIIKLMLQTNEVKGKSLKKIQVLRVISMVDLLCSLIILNYIKKGNDIYDAVQRREIESAISNINIHSLIIIDKSIDQVYKIYKSIHDKKQEDIPLTEEDKEFDYLLSKHKKELIEKIEVSSH